jgi:hypothetical protein
MICVAPERGPVRFPGPLQVRARIRRAHGTRSDQMTRRMFSARKSSGSSSGRPRRTRRPWTPVTRRSTAAYRSRSSPTTITVCCEPAGSSSATSCRYLSMVSEFIGWCQAPTVSDSRHRLVELVISPRAASWVGTNRPATLRVADTARRAMAPARSRPAGQRRRSRPERTPGGGRAHRGRRTISSSRAGVGHGDGTRRPPVRRAAVRECAANGDDLEGEAGGREDARERVDRGVDDAVLDARDGRPGDLRVRGESPDREPGGPLRVGEELTDVHGVSVFAYVPECDLPSEPCHTIGYNPGFVVARRGSDSSLPSRCRVQMGLRANVAIERPPARMGHAVNRSTPASR